MSIDYLSIPVKSWCFGFIYKVGRLFLARFSFIPTCLRRSNLTDVFQNHYVYLTPAEEYAFHSPTLQLKKRGPWIKTISSRASGFVGDVEHERNLNLNHERNTSKGWNFCCRIALEIGIIYLRHAMISLCILHYKPIMYMHSSLGGGITNLQKNRVHSMS